MINNNLKTVLSNGLFGKPSPGGLGDMSTVKKVLAIAAMFTVVLAPFAFLYFCSKAYWAAKNVRQIGPTNVPKDGSNFEADKNQLFQDLKRDWVITVRDAGDSFKIFVPKSIENEEREKATWKEIDTFLYLLEKFPGWESGHKERALNLISQGNTAIAIKAALKRDENLLLVNSRWEEFLLDLDKKTIESRVSLIMHDSTEKVGTFLDDDGSVLFDAKGFPIDEKGERVKHLWLASVELKLNLENPENVQYTADIKEKPLRKGMYEREKTA